MIGKFVTARLLGEDDCRQGWVINTSPLKIEGQTGEQYLCEGNPTTVINPPKRRKSTHEI